MAEIGSRGFDAARENEAKYGSRESGVRFNKKKPHYAKVGGDFSEALQADEWAKFTDAMTNMDAGLRISENSMLVPCDSGIFKYVIYDKASDNRITAVYRFGGIKYNNVVDIDIAANKIASFIYEQESKGYAEPKILRRLLRDHCKNFGYILDRYNPNSKRFTTIGNGIAQNKAVSQRTPSGAGVSGQAQGGVSGSGNLKNKKGKFSKDDTVYEEDYEGQLPWSEREDGTGEISEDWLNPDNGSEQQQEKRKRVNVRELLGRQSPEEAVYNLHESIAKRAVDTIRNAAVYAELEEADATAIARRLMRGYHISLKRNGKLIDTISKRIMKFIEDIQNSPKSDYTVHLNALYADCRRYLEHSGRYERGFMYDAS